MNDVWHEISRGEGTDIVRYERVYRMLLDDTLARFPNLKIMLLEPFILEGSATDGEERWQRFLEVKEYAKVVKKIAEEYGLTFVPLQEKFDEIAKNHDATEYLFDGVHPSAAGAKLIAVEWLKAFKTLEESM